MSIIFSLLVLFSCLSMNACSARRFGVIIHKSSSPQVHFPTKVMENVKESDQKYFNVEKTNGSGSIVDKSHDHQNAIFTQESSSYNTKARSDQGNMKLQVSGHVPTKPLDSVSWRRPDKIHGKLPGFFSDYSQPRMRTPSHN